MVSIAQGIGGKTTLRDRLVTDAWRHRSESIEELQRLADELPSRSSQKEVRQLLAAWGRCKSELDVHDEPRILQWICCFVEPTSPRSRARQYRFLERRVSGQQSRRDTHTLIAYPIVLLLTSFAVSLLFCFVVVPPFDTIFQDFGMRVPASTELLLSISAKVREIGGSTIAIVGLTLLGVAWGLARFLSLRDRQLRRTGVFSTFITRRALVEALNDFDSFQEIGLTGSEAIEVTRDRLFGRFYDPAEQQHPVVSFPDSCLPRELQPILHSPDEHDEVVSTSPGTNGTMSRELAVVWARIYEDRIAFQSTRLWFVLLDILLKMGIGLMILFLFVSLFSPLFWLLAAFT